MKDSKEENTPAVLLLNQPICKIPVLTPSSKTVYEQLKQDVETLRSDQSKLKNVHIAKEGLALLNELSHQSSTAPDENEGPEILVHFLADHEGQIHPLIILISRQKNNSEDDAQTKNKIRKQKSKGKEKS